MLQVRGVETGYGRLRILRGIDMSVGKGAIVALLGGNGTGKSTLLKAVSGLLPIWKGEILLDGQPTTTLSRTRSSAPGWCRSPRARIPTLA